MTQFPFEHIFKRIGWEDQITDLVNKLHGLGYLVKIDSSESYIKIDMAPYPKEKDLELIKVLIHKQNKKEWHK